LRPHPFDFVDDKKKIVYETKTFAKDSKSTTKITKEQKKRKNKWLRKHPEYKAKTVVIEINKVTKFYAKNGIKQVTRFDKNLVGELK